MIEVKHVVKSFDGFHALDGLTMTVPQGAIYGLVGPNGAGKSTILRHLAGVYRPDAGEILFDGTPVYENPAVKSRMAVIPDELYDFGSASTRDMMKFYRGIYPQFDAERYEKLREAFPAVDEKRPIRRLSKGMQKQSAFWLALSCRPDYLLLDEPVSALDRRGTAFFYELVCSLRSEYHMPVILVSHDLAHVQKYATSAALLDKTVIISGRVDKVMASDQVREVFGLPIVGRAGR